MHTDRQAKRHESAPIYVRISEFGHLHGVRNANLFEEFWLRQGPFYSLKIAQANADQAITLLGT